MSLPLSSWQPLSHIHHDEAPRLHSRPYFQSLFCLSCAVQLITAAFKGGHDFVAFRPGKSWLRAAAVIFLLSIQEKSWFRARRAFFAPRTRRHKMDAFRRIKAQFSTSRLAVCGCPFRTGCWLIRREAEGGEG